MYWFSTASLQIKMEESTRNGTSHLFVLAGNRYCGFGTSYTVLIYCFVRSKKKYAVLIPPDLFVCFSRESNGCSVQHLFFLVDDGTLVHAQRA